MISKLLNYHSSEKANEFLTNSVDYAISVSSSSFN